MEMTFQEPDIQAYEILTLVAGHRTRSYRLLGLCFHQPDQEVDAYLKSRKFFRDFNESTAWLGEDQARLSDAFMMMENSLSETSYSLEADYQRLFGRSIERVSPRESSFRWRDSGNLLDSRETLCGSLQHLYASFGVAAGAGLEDHIAVELEFIAYLCERESSFWKANHPKTAKEWRYQQHIFVNDHLSRWFPEFCYQIQQRSSQSFYTGAALLCDAWLSLDQGTGYASPVRNL
jgi:TorA maturation chaperone TorD